ncbi:MGMT family protein [uncultured Legionella sp.]|uniref:MGMT family protein n=1 Tax=uncultured Legionella sp. TaxID=210934 RepID=UPI002621EAAD|nr:MGMT family protein [uncultured Legionella sp.]
MKDTRTEFSKNVIELIQSIPKGHVTTYGLIARLAGNPRGSRRVGWLLHSSTQKYDLPWQRVIRADGSLSFPDHSPNFMMQKQLLEAEGIAIQNGRVDLNKFLWKGESLQGEADWFELL